jgi:AcrR family transcriptional regulator
VDKRPVKTISKSKRPQRLCTRQRAVWDDDKVSRGQDLISAASGLFSKADFTSIGILDICKAAGLAKGTFYLYFDSKEEIFLRVTQGFFEEWARQVLAQLGALGPSCPVETTARVYANSFDEFPQLLRLLAILHSVIERNISIEAIRPFKRMFAQIQMTQMAAFLRIYPQLSERHAADFLMFLSSSILGTWTMANPPESAILALEAEGLAEQIPKFQEAFARQIHVFLIGLLHTQ